MLSNLISGTLVFSGVILFNKAFNILTTKMRCPVCTEGFESDQGLISHIKIAHSNLINMEDEKMGILERFKREDKNIIENVLADSNINDFNVELPKENEFKNQREIKRFILTVNIHLSDFEAGKGFLDNVSDILERDEYAEIIEASIKKGE